jgi:hypothetical protein
MVPFRAYDREKKITWTVINFHPKADGGTYLAARGDDSDKDRALTELTIDQLADCRLVDFLDDVE